MKKRKHLHRLSNVWVRDPIYFVTIGTAGRRRCLTERPLTQIIRDAWNSSPHTSGWFVGRYVIMPDHVHFFARATPDAKSLSSFVRDWKRWTAHQAANIANIPPPLWPPEFFEHVLRSPESYSLKWDYVRTNPVRAGLAVTTEGWPYAGECEDLAF
jgi:REP element-mobilizing transposase RayT